MLTFQEFLNEDFNSNNATQIELPLKEKGSPTANIMVFHEVLPVRPFSLTRYMKSFGNDAKEIMRNKSAFGWRGIVFHNKPNLLVFVWSANYLHHDICKALETANKSPKLRYLKMYNTLYMLDKNEQIGDQWCFPFIFDNGIETNLGKYAMQELIKQKGIDKLFML